MNITADEVEVLILQLKKIAAGVGKINVVFLRSVSGWVAFLLARIQIIMIGNTFQVLSLIDALHYY